MSLMSTAPATRSVDDDCPASASNMEYPKLFRRARRTGLDHQHIKPLDFRHRAARDALQIAIQACRRIENSVQLRSRLAHNLVMVLRSRSRSSRIR